MTNTPPGIQSIIEALSQFPVEPTMVIVSDHDYDRMVYMGIIDPNDPLILPASRMNEINEK